MIQPSQIRDAAIVVKSLPLETREDILGYLPDESRKHLADSLKEIESVTGEEFYRASKRFRQLTGRSEQTPATETFSVEAPANARPWPADSLGSHTAPFAFLVHLRADARRRLIEEEHPQNVAMILASLTPAHASAITRELDPAFRVAVIRRLCELDVIDEAKLMELRYAIRMRAKRMLAIEHCTKQGLTVAADLLSVSDRQTRDSVIAWLDDRDRELCHELQQRILKIDDLAKFSDLEISKLLKRVDTSAWAGALRSTKPSVAQRMLDCMAPRAADIVTAEMESFDPLDETAMQLAVERVMCEAVKLKKEIPAADQPPWRKKKKRIKKRK